MTNPPTGCQKFVKGLKVLLVDDKPDYLQVLGNKLQALCMHEVTTCLGARDALSKLEEKMMSGLDIVMTECAMDGIDGLQLLDSIRSMQIFDQLPVLLFSDNLDTNLAAQAIDKGACDFLIKPIHDDQLQMIWKHVFRSSLKKTEVNFVGSPDANQLPHLGSSCVSPSMSEGSEKSSGMKRSLASGDDQDIGSNNGKSVKEAKEKKPRFSWTQEYDQIFKEAIVEVNKATKRTGRFLNVKLAQQQVVPKKILTVMQARGVPGITRHIVSSHLQKYRASLKKKPEEQQTGEQNGFSGSQGYCSSMLLGPHPSALSGFPCNAPPHHLPSQNLQNGHRAQQPNMFFPGSQPVGPLPACLLNQQHMIPINNNQRNQNCWNSGSNIAIGSPAPINWYHRTPSVSANQTRPLIRAHQPMDQPTFSQALNPSQFASAPMSLNQDIEQELHFDLEELEKYFSKEQT